MRKLALDRPRVVEARRSARPAALDWGVWRAQVVELKPAARRSTQLAGWLPLLLVFGGYSLSGLPSLNPILNALSVGLYLAYAALITTLHVLPRLSAELD